MYTCFPSYVVCIHIEEIEKLQNLPAGLDEPFPILVLAPGPMWGVEGIVMLLGNLSELEEGQFNGAIFPTRLERLLSIRAGS